MRGAPYKGFSFDILSVSRLSLKSLATTVTGAAHRVLSIDQHLCTTDS
jgi:hypothetical protein